MVLGGESIPTTMDEAPMAFPVKTEKVPTKMTNNNRIKVLLIFLPSLLI
jgi:hypothetical protein